MHSSFMRRVNPCKTVVSESLLLWCSASLHRTPRKRHGFLEVPPGSDEHLPVRTSCRPSLGGTGPALRCCWQLSNRLTAGHRKTFTIYARKIKFLSACLSSHYRKQLGRLWWNLDGMFGIIWHKNRHCVCVFVCTFQIDRQLPFIAPETE